ncbi:MAG: copper amine oxidase N-terminal domain-containing protein [Armatimonadetes bacterium]|nr:copper amine oxidase N-terminal domain-containing protein [Armatimonadota bacterium]MDE2205670.1 copper amine oxidase N-terminal domain-containing protein [Armatimonadota bacterium]
MLKPIRTTLLGVMAITISAASLAGQITVTVNSVPVHFLDVQPQMVNGHVLVPLRGVLESMGAKVDWNAATQTVVAVRQGTEIDLPIGSHAGTVNGRQVDVAVPATTIGGRTMVPLRFMSEALGANVGWSDYTQTVSITTSGGAERVGAGGGPRSRPNGGRPAAHHAPMAYVAAGTVVPLTLDEALSSRNSQPGDRFTASVENGSASAGLPNGTRFHGTVRSVVPASNGRPGVLDLAFQSVELPNGDIRPVSGSAYSTDAKYVSRRADGVLVAKNTSSNDTLKWVGIGAGAGLVVGTLLKGNKLVDTVLGGGAGYLFSKVQGKKASDVNLAAGTRMGVRFDKRFAYSTEGLSQYHN